MRKYKTFFEGFPSVGHRVAGRSAVEFSSKEVIDLNPFVSGLKFFDGWMAIFLRAAGYKIPILSILRFERHPHLIEVMRIKVALLLTSHNRNISTIPPRIQITDWRRLSILDLDLEQAMASMLPYGANRLAILSYDK
jgi:hypothetical protein